MICDVDVDKFIVGIAPPESYLDIYGSGRFSRYVNLTEPERRWHPEFHYFGANGYAYLLTAKFGEFIDFVSIQFYESYSRAGMTVHEDGISPAEYLQKYVEKANVGGYLAATINFSDDAELNYPSETIRIPLSKLVFGLANGWADDGGDKTLYMSPEQVEEAWKVFDSKGVSPRGLMFWTINEEGSNGVYFAQELSRILKNRSWL